VRLFSLVGTREEPGTLTQGAPVFPGGEVETLSKRGSIREHRETSS
jgi:hypothetical protein